MGNLVKPGGVLLTLMFPLKDLDPFAQDKPPFPLKKEDYQTRLPSNGFELVSLHDVPGELSHPDRAGFEAFGVWKKL